MTLPDLFAVCRESLVAAGPLPGLPGGRAVVAGGFAALLCPPLPQARPQAAGALLARQRLLETLGLAGDVLAARPGTRLTEAQARRFLIGNAAVLAAGLGQVAGRLQHQVTLSWDPAGVLGRFAGAPEFAGLAGIDPADRARFGAALQAGAAALAARLGAGFRPLLADCAEDAIELPCAGPDMLLNLVCLLPRGREELIDPALSAIDAVWPEGFLLKVTGPLPPLSFTAVAGIVPGRAALAAARARLWLGAEASAAEIARAFRLRAAVAHPDHGGAEGALAALVAARDLLAGLARAEAALAAAGEGGREAGREGGGLPVLARLCREGDAETGMEAGTDPGLHPGAVPDAAGPGVEAVA